MLVDVSFANAPDEIIERVAVWTVGRPHFFLPELWKVVSHPGLRHVGGVGRCTVLLKDIVSSTRCLFHPGFHEFLHDFKVDFRVDSLAL